MKSVEIIGTGTINSMSKLDDQILVFNKYLEERIQRKYNEMNMPDTSSRSKDLLKTEIAEAEVIFNYFKKIFYDES